MRMKPAGVLLASGIVVGLSALFGAIAFGSGRTAPAAALVPSRDVRFVRAPAGVTVDDALWLSAGRFLVTIWPRKTVFTTLDLTSLGSETFKRLTTLTEPGCKPMSALFPVLDRGRVVYLASCWANQLSQRSGLASLDPQTGQNRRFGPYRFSQYFNGRFSFSPGGARAVIDTGGLNSKLEWLTGQKVVPVQQGLAEAEGPTWSPDGKLIMFGGVTEPHNDADIAELPTNLYTFAPSTPTRLHRVVSGLKNFRPSGVAWMPNSKWVVANIQPPGQPSGLWIVDATTGRKALLLAGTEFGRPMVSPDGRKVAVGTGVDANIDPALGLKAQRVGIDVFPLPSQDLLSTTLR